MKNIIEMPSLCPYLESKEARFFLAFSPVSRDNFVDGKAPFPFISIDPSGPLSRIVMAHMVSDAGSEIKPVFVVLQQDVYKIPKDPLRPFGNKAVDACWQKTFSHWLGQDLEEAPIVLSVQTSEDGQLVPFQSLFFCKKTNLFFPPPCPACGNALHQCYDDDWLTSQELQPYSTSLKRYLFCPTCSDLVGQSDFYVYELDATDSPKLKDRWDLIRGFGRLIEGKIQAHRFPCLECSDSQDCYGTGSQAASRITPFCFYPFFMLIYPAMSMQAQDFLALLSGRTAQALRKHLEANEEIGRARCVEKFHQRHHIGSGFLFHGDERHFLEVLYLKLCFLDMLFQALDSQLDTFGYPDTGPSLDGVWVKLNNDGGLLPFLWDFDSRIIGPRGSTEGLAAPGIPFAQGLYSMGVFWLYALLVNKAQGVAEVFESVKAVIEKSGDLDEASQKELVKKSFAHATSPENIFWDPMEYAEKAFDHEWLTLWNKAVDMGWSLLMAGIKGHLGFSKEAFRQDCQRLREQIKKHLFANRPSPAVLEAAGVGTTSDIEAQGRFSADKSISNMLGNIADKWRDELKTAQGKDSDGATKGTDRDLDETVMLSPEQAEGGGQVAVVAEDEDEIHETVILSSGDFAEGSAYVPPEHGDLEETVILSAETDSSDTAAMSEQTATKAPRRAAPAGEGMPDTVVISPPQASDVKSGFVKPEERPLGGITEEDEAPETVIISPAQKGVAFPEPHEEGRRAGSGPIGVAEDVASKRPTTRGEDGDLTETVVIRTNKSVDKK